MDCKLNTEEAKQLTEKNDGFWSQMTSPVESGAKRQVLTHVIDGFIIEESLTPFPLWASSLLSSHQLNMIRKRQQEIMSREKDKECDGDDGSVISNKYEEDFRKPTAATATCEQCGFFGPRVTFSTPSRQFCSLGCARKYKSGFAKKAQAANKLRQAATAVRRGRRPIRGGLLQSHSVRQRRRKGYSMKKLQQIPVSPSHSISDSSFSECDCTQSSDDVSVFSYSPSPSPEPIVPYRNDIPIRPAQWSVEDVWKYLRSLPDSVHHADDFRAQEIDGSALLLLHEEHLVGSMNLPLGPALKLCAHIDRLREQEIC